MARSLIQTAVQEIECSLHRASIIQSTGVWRIGQLKLLFKRVD